MIWLNLRKSVNKNICQIYVLNQKQIKRKETRILNEKLNVELQEFIRKTEASQKIKRKRIKNSEAGKVQKRIYWKSWVEKSRSTAISVKVIFYKNRKYQLRTTTYKVSFLANYIIFSKIYFMPKSMQWIVDGVFHTFWQLCSAIAIPSHAHVSRF